MIFWIIYIYFLKSTIFPAKSTIWSTLCFKTKWNGWSTRNLGSGFIGREHIIIIIAIKISKIFFLLSESFQWQTWQVSLFMWYLWTFKAVNTIESYYKSCLNMMDASRKEGGKVILMLQNEVKRMIDEELWCWFQTDKRTFHHHHNS